MTYDFKALSDFDFELLVRDLLQAEWGLHLESFKSGRDGGIDLRYSKTQDNTIIIQCKHYANSKFADLIYALKNKEKKKVDTLRPTRYVLATSLSCTAKEKEEIRNIFPSYCTSTTDDVFSAEDLNNLLTKHPDVEKQQFKLWLTSTTVMEKLLHSGTYAQSETEIELIKKKILTYVANKSFSKTQEILKKYHYCVISGIPGIGKTTLADILLIHYVDQGFEAIKISKDIEDAYVVLNSTKKQIFYYDDFLGATNLNIDKLSKNEDQRLIQFIQACENTSNTLFILTTREYILNQAKLNYEKLDKFDMTSKCILDLSSYTKRQKARILFNHLAYSNTPLSHIYNLVHSKQYIAIINHKNYNPRIIEWMTNRRNLESIPEEQYTSDFLKNLDNPTQIWAHAYENQITEESRYLLLFLATLPSHTALENVENIFLAFYESKGNSPLDINKKFTSALKELDNSFIQIQKIQGTLFIAFHNPSIRDFIEGQILENAKTMKFLYLFCIYFDQLRVLYNFSQKNPCLMIYFSDAIISKFGTSSLASETLESRLSFLLLCNVAQADVNTVIDSSVNNILDRLEENKCSSTDLLNLIQQITKIRAKLQPSLSRLVNNAKLFFMRNLDDLNDFDNAIRFLGNFDEIDPADIETLSVRFNAIVTTLIDDLINCIDNFPTEFDLVGQQVTLLNDTADYLHVSLPKNEDLDLSLRAFQYRYESSIPDYDHDEIDVYNDDSPEDFSSMFDSLLDEHINDESN